jgi:hypothetical protein
MYINSVLSFLGAWKRLHNECPLIIEEIERGLLGFTDIDHFTKISQEVTEPGKKMYDIRRMDRTFGEMLKKSGWSLNVRIFPEGRKVFRYTEVDAVKDNVGVELIFGKWFFIESLLFTRFPLFIRAKKFQIAIILVPMKSLVDFMSAGIASFELMNDILESVPLALKYPFVIIGFSAEKAEREVFNLTTELDEFLVEQIGYTLDEMILLHEMHNYDFKLKFSGGDRFNETICAFSNINSGGMFLFGIADNGAIVGLPKGKELDGIKLGIRNVISNGKHLPVPRFSFHVFDAPDDANLCIFIMRVQGSESKPCTFDGRIYIRSGPSTQIATPDEIRRLVLRQDHDT